MNSGKAELKTCTKLLVEKNLKVIARDSNDGFYYPGKRIKPIVHIQQIVCSFIMFNNVKIFLMFQAESAA